MGTTDKYMKVSESTREEKAAREARSRVNKGRLGTSNYKPTGSGTIEDEFEGRRELQGARTRYFGESGENTYNRERESVDKEDFNESYREWKRTRPRMPAYKKGGKVKC